MKRFKVYYSLNDKKMFSIVETTSEDEAKQEVMNKLKIIKIEELMTKEEMEVAHKAVDTLRESAKLLEEARETYKTDVNRGLDLHLDAINKLKQAKQIADSI